MFKRFMLRFRDMKTISRLISGADEQANLNGEEKPGAEHFVLSALSLEDGSAKRVFDKFGADENKFRDAINQQYSDALSLIGLSREVTETTPEPVETNKMLHNSQPSGQELMKSLYAIKQRDKDRPLLGAHVISVAAEMKQGVVARAFKVMGIDRVQIAKLAKDEWESL